MRITALLMIVVLGCGLAGCGQKGPLYLPSDTNPPAAPR